MTKAWGLQAVGALTSGFDGTGVVPAVLDSGIDGDHEAFRGIALDRRDFGGSGLQDADGHGTHCAGTIFGRDVGGVRIGVARGVERALIAKVFPDSGAGDSEMVFRAMNWVRERGANVISMSLGFDFPGFVDEMARDGWPTDLATSVALEAYRENLRMFDAIMGVLRAHSGFGSGPIVVAAAGNESRRQVKPEYRIAASLPAAAVDVISVAALAQRPEGLAVADFSNTRAEVSAPGVDVLSAAAGGGLRPDSGTSMACPHVAGVALLWWQALRQSAGRANGGDVSARVRASARVEGFAPGFDADDRGLGLIQAP